MGCGSAAITSFTTQAQAQVPATPGAPYLAAQYCEGSGDYAGVAQVCVAPVDGATLYNWVNSVSGAELGTTSSSCITLTGLYSGPGGAFFHVKVQAGNAAGWSAYGPGVDIAFDQTC